MKSHKPIGLSLGFLAGTTLGSGIAFLLRLAPYPLMCCVALCGLAGMVSGLLTAMIRQNRIQKQES
ncbi:hypothetical protein HUB98_26870 [Paenibacillus barcinonensis]|uniref:Secreted protein with PEP-CTERM sorting signal n=1 Tax=Paenibacillus barcinonensis TaxID=198119 RepID=A0ABX6QB92_PAEBA|nr:hypothetical protein [Paenibacillus barcinonensis]QKS59470.1 hypothetical protein HUB98_26870 [Paenibacillus barcinonensis]